MTAEHTQRGAWTVQVAHGSRGEYEISLNLSDAAREAGRRSWGHAYSVERLILYGSGHGENMAGDRKDEGLANALLMVRAPQMLELLREVGEALQPALLAQTGDRALELRIAALLDTIDHPASLASTMPPYIEHLHTCETCARVREGRYDASLCAEGVALRTKQAAGVRWESPT